MPDYDFRLQADILEVRPKAVFIEAYEDSPDQGAVAPRIFLSSTAYERGREAAPGWDIYFLEQEWRLWMDEPPRDPDAAFVGFCRKWFERRGRP